MFKKQIILIIALLFLMSSLFAQEKYKEIYWEDLEVKDHRAEDIYKKYIDEINKIPENSPKADAIFKRINNEIDNVPLNTKLHNSYIKIPGFIAPLNQEGEFINEFLLVPYFGACIHSPPPPSNQVIYVKASKKNRVSLDNSILSIWVYGKLQTTGKNTDIGNASIAYQMLKRNYMRKNDGQNLIANYGLRKNI